MPLTHFRTVTPIASAFVALLALFAGLVVAVPAAQAADVTDGLILKYDLTQASGATVVDSSGNGKDGTLGGGGTLGGPTASRWTARTTTSSCPTTLCPA